MCDELLKKRKCIFTIVTILVLFMINPLFALDHFWTGAVSSDAADPRNWDNGSANPTLPSSGDIVRIGCTSGWADYVAVNQPVLTSEWDGRNGGPSAGWWFVLGVGNQNTLTIGDGAYIEFSKNDCNLRNGGILHVTGQRTGGGPSIVIPPRFRLANNGDSVIGATGTIRIDDDGYLRFDPAIATGGSGGTEIYIGALVNALIEIRDDGILELVSGMDVDDDIIVSPQFIFGSGDPNTNKIVISGNGKLILAAGSTTATVDGQERSLEYLIANGYITTDEAGRSLKIEGTDPVVVSLPELRITKPSPADSAEDVATEAVLSWEAGLLADTYDVYLGTDAASVGSADRNNPLDVLKSQDQVETYCPLDGTLSLDYGQTYYWRVDEVNAAESAIYTGAVWSFTVEPFARAISADNIIATASSQAEGQGPENTINESGLVEDLHSLEPADMWATVEGEAAPAWIQYEFNKPYKLHEMLVWNYNGQSLLSAIGAKDVVVEYSIDGLDWKTNDSVTVFNQATGEAGYAANTIVPFDDVPVKLVKITVNSNWGGAFFAQYGLSEVRFLHIPVDARGPDPADGASDVDINVTLGWRAGREATEHKVYISADEQAVIGGTVAAVTVGQTSYGPLSLNLGSTYYWRVDEVNNTNADPIWEGNVWSFSTIEYRVVDDFESYNDISAGDEGSNLVYLTWIDGYDNPTTNGSTMGYVSGASMETSTVHGGRQAAPLMYNNTTASVSKVTASTGDLPGGSNWTIGSPEQLVIWVYGSADNAATERMFAEIGGVKKIFTGDIAAEEWQEFSIDLASLGVNLNNVGTVTIGLEKLGSTGGSGTIFIDDIWLYRPLQ